MSAGVGRSAEADVGGSPRGHGTHQHNEEIFQSRFPVYVPTRDMANLSQHADTEPPFPVWEEQVAAGEERWVPAGRGRSCRNRLTGRVEAEVDGRMML